MMSFKQTKANGNDSCNKPFPIRIEQIFRSSLKATWFIKIKHYLRRNSKLCGYHLKNKKTQDDSGFYCKQVQEMPLLILPETVV